MQGTLQATWEADLMAKVDLAESQPCEIAPRLPRASFEHLQLHHVAIEHTARRMLLRAQPMTYHR